MLTRRCPSDRWGKEVGGGPIEMALLQAGLTCSESCCPDAPGRNLQTRYLDADSPPVLTLRPGRADVNPVAS